MAERLRPDLHGQARPHLTGSSGHLHMSLWDKAGREPLFYDAKAKQYGMSTTMRHFLGG